MSPLVGRETAHKTTDLGSPWASLGDGERDLKGTALSHAPIEAGPWVGTGIRDRAWAAGDV